jgi:ABC-type Mn2+/Zn2+ transport system permease subunit
VDWWLEPFALEFMQRALVAGALAAATCALVGIWVVLRGLAFMGDALAHGVLPGIAVAYLAGVDTTLGAAAGALVMVGGVTLVQRRSRLPEDTGIGLLFVGMLALGVLIVSRAGSYFGDLVSFLFGAILAVTPTDLAVQLAAALVALATTLALYRPLLLLAFDERKAEVLGFRPALTRFGLLALIALAVVASFRTVGSLLVFALLIAPPATASLLVRRVPAMMLTGVAAGVLAVYLGLLLSYHYDLAAGAAVAATAVAQFFAVLAVREIALSSRRSGDQPDRRRGTPARA